MAGFESLEQVSEYLANNGESEEVQSFLSKHTKTAELDKDIVLEFLESDKGFPIKQSLSDKAFAEGLEKWKESQLPKIVETELLKANPPKTEAEKRLAEMEARLAASDAERLREKMTNETIKYFSENEALKGHEKYATALAELSISSTAEATEAKREKMLNLFKEMANAVKAAEMASLARQPKGGTAIDQTSDIDAQIKALEEQHRVSPGNHSTLAAINALYAKKREQTT